MARPAKSIELAEGAHTKKDIAIRVDVQDKLAGEKLKLKYPDGLTPSQKKYYKWLFDNLKTSGFLSVLDSETLRNAAIIIDRLNNIDASINDNDGAMLLDRQLASLRDLYYKQYLNVCKELCLSPASRAKMGTLAVNALKNEEDPLAEALKI